MIDEAVLILKDLSIVVKEIEELRKKGMQADIDEVVAIVLTCETMVGWCRPRPPPDSAWSGSPC